MARTLTYTNDFDGNENIAGSLEVTVRPGQGGGNGLNTVIQDSDDDADADSELILYDGDQVGGYAEFADEEFDDGSTWATSFSMTADVDLIGIAGGTDGNGQVDGFSFNFGDTSTLPAAGDGVNTPLQGALEQGVSEGLTVRFLPISDTIEIVWNGTVIASATDTGLETMASVQLGVSVSDTGLVTVTFDGSTVLTGQIPDSGGQTGLRASDQTDWGFSFAGRTGGNGGEVWIDDISLTANLVCFASGAMIETDGGLVAVEELQVGDLVRTRDNGLQPVRWLGQRELSREDLDAHPTFLPVRISAGALGLNTPSTELLVSQQHRLLARSKIVERVCDSHEVLVAAKHLTELPGVEIVNAKSVTYHHVLFDRHEIIFANGVETESFFPGSQALNSVGHHALCEILALFPELAEQSDQYKPALPLIAGRKGRQIARRTKKNERNLIDTAVGQAEFVSEKKVGSPRA